MYLYSVSYRVIKKSLCPWWLQYRKRCTDTFWSLCIHTAWPLLAKCTQDDQTLSVHLFLHCNYQGQRDFLIKLYETLYRYLFGRSEENWRNLSQGTLCLDEIRTENSLPNIVYPNSNYVSFSQSFQKKNIYICTVFHTRWSKSLCAPDDYNTEKSAQILFDHPVYIWRDRSLSNNSRFIVALHSIIDHNSLLPAL
jgi:hypothetical protein